MVPPGHPAMSPLVQAGALIAGAVVGELLALAIIWLSQHV